MDEDEKELLDDYRMLFPENKAHLKSLAYATKTAQEATRKALERVEEVPPEDEKTS